KLSAAHSAMMWAHRLVPLVIGAPVALGTIISLFHLLATPHPYLGWADAIASDGKAIALGKIIYGDPAEGYTGLLYAPLFPLILAPLYRLFWWDGWPLVAAIGSGMTLAGL